MATVTLGSKPEGSIVKLNESGSPVEFYVAKQNYESGLNGTGRVLLVRKDCYDNQAWDAGNVNAYASSDIDAWFNSTYKNLLDPDIQQAIGTTKFRYTPGNGNYTVDTLERSIFALSLTELGESYEYANVEGSALPIASTLKIAYLNGNATNQWTRSPHTKYIEFAIYLYSNGSAVGNNCNISVGSRPVFTLPATAKVADDGTISLSQPPTAPASITVPTLASGAQAAITWTAATDPDGTIASYTLERSINGSGWTQIFSGNALTYTDTIGDWGTVTYRVCAVDNDGMSGDYATSETITVQDAVFYISGPAPDMGEQTAPFDFTITTGISGPAQTVSGVTCTILLDGYNIYTDYTSTGEDTTVNIDVRAISGGAHTITAKADKAGYVSVVQQYTFTTPAIPFPDGGQAEQLQNQSGTPIFPQTTAALVQGLKGESIAGNIEELFSYAKIELLVNAPVGSTVTATNGEISLPGVLATNGLCSFILPQYGEWTITAAMGSQTASTSITVNTVQQYEVSLAFTHIYGVLWDGTSQTAMSRTDNAAAFVDPVPYVAGASTYSSPFDTLMPWAGMERVTDPEAGELVAIPKYWYRWTKSGNSLKLQIADGPAEGFFVSPAHCDRGDGKGERDVVYIGRYHCGSNYKSVTGVLPLANITREAARNGIHALGSTIYQWDWAIVWTARMLYMVEFAEWNSQTAVGYGCGNGSSAGSMGYTDSMPYHTGTTQASRTTYGLGTQYRYIEGLWDNVYDWVDGCYYNNNGLNIILNPANFSDTTGGTAIGVPVGGYPTALGMSEALGNQWVYPTAAGGSDSTYVPDNWVFYASYPCLRVGGYYGQSLDRGLFYVYCNAASSASSYIGSRLMKLP